MLLASYKVGHPQFYVPWLVLVAWLLVDQRAPEERDVARGFLPVVAFLGLFQVLYILGLVSTLSPIRDYVGLPFFGLALGSLFAAFRAVGFADGQRAFIRW